MSGAVLREFPSRRNRVCLMARAEGPVVKKRFASVGAAEKEAAVYHSLEGTGVKTARLLVQEESCLSFELLNGEDYVRLLERQEAEGFSPAPWDALLDWLLAFHRATGLVQRDMNLRNFLWLNGEAAGLDFEDCGPGEPAEMLAQLGAFVLNYDPAHTGIKERIAAHIRSRVIDMGLYGEDAFSALLAREEKRLLARRQGRRV